MRRFLRQKIDLRALGFGVIRVEAFFDTAMVDVDETGQVDCVGAAASVTAFRMWLDRTETQGAIVNVSSIASAVGTPGHATYFAAKAALDTPTRVMAIELGRHANAHARKSVGGSRKDGWR